MKYSAFTGKPEVPCWIMRK